MTGPPRRSPFFPYPPLSRSLLDSDREAGAGGAHERRHRAAAGERARRQNRCGDHRRQRQCEIPPCHVPSLEFVADRKSTRLNSSHLVISYAVFCLKKKKKSP